MSIESKLELVKYRDWGMPTYTFFWVNSNHSVISPYFDTQEEAYRWIEQQLHEHNNKKV